MTGNKAIDNIILILSCICTAAALGSYIYTEMVYKPPPIVDSQEVKELLKFGQQSSKYLSYKLDKLTINIQSTRSRMRYLNVITHLIPFKERYLEQFEEKKSRIQDVVIDISSKMQPNDLNSISGKILLESRIKKRVNSLYGRPMVKEVLFSEFVVQ